MLVALSYAGACRATGASEQGGGLGAAEPPTFTSGANFENSPSLFVSQNILQGPFCSHKTNYSVKTF